MYTTKEHFLTTYINYKTYNFNVKLENKDEKHTYIVCIIAEYLPFTDSDYSLFFRDGHKFIDDLKYINFINYAEYYVQNQSIVSLTEDDFINEKIFNYEMILLKTQYNPLTYQITDLRPLDKRFSRNTFNYIVSLINPNIGSDLEKNEPSYKITVCFKNHEKSWAYNNKPLTDTLSYSDFKLYFNELDNRNIVLKLLNDVNKSLDINVETAENFNDRMKKLKQIYEELEGNELYRSNTYIKYYLLYYWIAFEYNYNKKKLL